MTIDEFRRKYPDCRVGKPFPTVTFWMSFLFLGVVVGCLLMLLSLPHREFHTSRDIMAPFGALCLSFSCFAGTVMCVQRVIEVLGWRSRGFCSFAVAAEAALLVGEKGQSVLVPMSEIAGLEIHIHTVTITTKPGFAPAGALASLVAEVLQPGGDGPQGREFFQAFEPLVKKHAPGATIANQEPESLFSILKG